MLFLLFIYDVTISIINSNLLMYADDVKIYFSYKKECMHLAQFSPHGSAIHNVELFTDLEIINKPGFY